jgi:hypothetical protein
MKDNYNIQLPKSNWKDIITYDDWIRLHTITLAVARPNTGKTAALSTMLKIHHAQGALDRLIIVSPTFDNNAFYFKGLPIDEENDVVEPDEYTCQWIVDELQQMADEYDDYYEKIKLWKLLEKQLKSNIPIDDITDELLLEFLDEDGYLKLEKPTYKYSHLDHPPIVHILFDDVQGTPVFARGKKGADGVRLKCIDDIVIKHRHLGKRKNKQQSLGCSLYFATQTYKSGNNGLPRCIRGCLKHMLIFKNKDEKSLLEIQEEVGGQITRDQFFDLFNRAVQTDHDFLFIDLFPKKNHVSIFRRNFTEFLLP